MMQNSPCCPRTLGYPPQVPIWSWRGCALSMPRQAPFQGHIPRCLVEGCGGLHRNGNTLLSWKEGPLLIRPGTITRVWNHPMLPLP